MRKEYLIREGSRMYELYTEEFLKNSAEGEIVRIPWWKAYRFKYLKDAFLDQITKETEANFPFQITGNVFCLRVSLPLEWQNYMRKCVGLQPKEKACPTLGRVFVSGGEKLTLIGGGEDLYLRKVRGLIYLGLMRDLDLPNEIAREIREEWGDELGQKIASYIEESDRPGRQGVCIHQYENGQYVTAISFFREYDLSKVCSTQDIIDSIQKNAGSEEGRVVVLTDDDMAELGEEAFFPSHWDYCKNYPNG